MYVYYDIESGFIFHGQEEEANYTEGSLVTDDGYIPRSRGTYGVAYSDIIPSKELLNRFVVLNGRVFYRTEEDELFVKWSEVRSKRDQLLLDSDVRSGIGLFDYWALKTDDEKSVWLAYRKNLRDITTNFDNPDNVVFPPDPEVVLANKDLLSAEEWLSFTAVS